MNIENTPPVLALGTDFDNIALRLRWHAYGTREAEAGAPTLDEILDACRRLRVQTEAMLPRLRALTFAQGSHLVEVRTERGTVVTVAATADEAQRFVAREVYRALRFMTDLADVMAIVVTPTDEPISRSAGLIS